MPDRPTPADSPLISPADTSPHGQVGEDAYEHEPFDRNALRVFSVLAYFAAALFGSSVVLGGIAIVRRPDGIVLFGIISAVAMMVGLYYVAARGLDAMRRPRRVLLIELAAIVVLAGSACGFAAMRFESMSANQLALIAAVACLSPIVFTLYYVRTRPG